MKSVCLRDLDLGEEVPIPSEESQTQLEGFASKKDAKFRSVRLDPNFKMKDYMRSNTFDGYKVTLKFFILNSDGSDKDAGILHFQVIRTVGEILSELLRLRKIEVNVNYEIVVKVPANADAPGILIEKGSEILLCPVGNL